MFDLPEQEPSGKREELCSNHKIEKRKSEFFEILTNQRGDKIPHTKTNPGAIEGINSHYKKFYEPIQNLLNHLLDQGVYGFIENGKLINRQDLNSNEVQEYQKLHELIKGSPNSERARHSQNHHEFTPLEHTKTIINNRKKLKIELYSKLQIDKPDQYEQNVLGSEIITIMDELGFLLHDIAKEMPYYTRNKVGLRTRHSGHELMGAYLINPKKYEEKVHKHYIYQTIYSEENWSLIDNAAKSINNSLIKSGYNEQEVNLAGFVIELHFKISKIRNKLIDKNLYDIKQYTQRHEEVKQIVKNATHELINEYISQKETNYQSLSLQQYLHLIGVTYLWDNISKIQFTPNLDNPLDKNHIYQQKLLVEQKAQKIAQEGYDNKSINNLMQSSYGYFTLGGLHKYNDSDKKTYEIVNKIIEYNEQSQNIGFIMKNDHKKFLNQKHYNAYVNCINVMHVNLRIFKDYYDQIACILDQKK